VAGSSRASASTQRAQHFLASRGLAAELAQGAELGPDDLVLEIGAGFGRLTDELAARAGRVVAIELDGKLATRLAARFQGRSGVQVLQEDALRVPLPRRPFKVVSNPPFHLTSRLLGRLLDDPAVPLARADLVLDWRAAVSLAAVHPPSRQSIGWQPWFEFLLLRRLPASSFSPEPAVDAAVVSVRRRAQPLVNGREAPGFRQWLRRQPRDVDVWEMVRRYRRDAKIARRSIKGCY
jgi:23S rRNA (adenine-N6)-dimethyltransferase